MVCLIDAHRLALGCTDGSVAVIDMNLPQLIAYRLSEASIMSRLWTGLVPLPQCVFSWVFSFSFVLFLFLSVSFFFLSHVSFSLYLTCVCYQLL